MKAIRNLFARLLRIDIRLRGPMLLALGAGLVGLLLVIPPSWEYSNSAQFCGETCHTMPPEYKTYQVSPHARVPCVDCHIGRDWIAIQFTRKIGHTRLVAATALDRYELPIYSHEMRPARDTCEECHSPEKFSDDSLRIIHRYENDRENTPYDIYLLMHTGGGSERIGLARGIHWHVENPVTYISTPGDRREQEIPWVRVEREDGTTVEYNALNSPIDTSNLEQYEIREMDCISCHNRIAHLIETPQDSVDLALAKGDLSTDIPFIRVRAIELLSMTYPTQELALESIETLDGYYRDNYPEFYNESEGPAQVQQAIETLTRIYQESNFPEQLLTWDTHPNNIGHDTSAGCFRCHDGEHFSEQGDVIRLECNLCHSIPQVVRSGEIEPVLPLATGLEPATHLDPSWIARHHQEFDASCSNCHTTSNPGGTDDSSFCSNSGCHSNEWQYAGFDAPGLAAMLGIYRFEPEPLLVDFEGTPTYEVLQPLFVQQCAGCHGAVPTKGLQVTNYESLMAGSESGPVIIPGDPAESRIVQVLEAGHFATFTPHQMELLINWIASGAPETE